MSYNPTRHGKETHPAKVRPSAPPPGAGIGHDEIMRRHRGPSSLPASGRKDTTHGTSVDLFVCEQFTTRVEVMRPRNNTGLGINVTGDRTVVVMRGVLWATIDGQMAQYREGTYLHLPRGVRHALATSLESVELYITETPNYGDGWTQIEPPTVSTDAPDESTAAPTPIPRRVDDGVSQQQAVEIAEENATRRRRAAARTGPPANANSSNVIGLNPRPMGAGKASEE